MRDCIEPIPVAEAQLPNRLYVDIGMEAHTLRVIEVSKNAIHLVPIRLPQASSQAGVVCTQAILHWQGQEIKGLDVRLCAARLEEAVMVAQSHNDTTSALLWQLWYAQHHAVQAPAASFSLHEEALLVPQRGQYTEAARHERLAFIRAKTGAALQLIGDSSIAADTLNGNLEAYIGSVEVPLGVAGPLRIHGQHAQGVFYAPIATTEGALVASITRGARALTRSGAVTTHISGQRMTRVPLFVFTNMPAAVCFATWLSDHFDVIKAKTREYSHYADLQLLEPQVHGKAVHVHFVYVTGDAAGQNMTTTCTWHACLWILEQLKRFAHLRVEHFQVEANLSGDKKVTYQSLLRGRGMRVQAEAWLTEPVLNRILKVTSKQFLTGYQGMLDGALQSGMVGFNVNVANVIAGIFTATGQDIACVHESALAHLSMEPAEDGVYVCLTLPSLIIGTVGGGTALPQQRECLDMLGCAGPGKVQKFAEIIAAYCLALDCSTLAALVGGQFAVAHEKLGRNRPVHLSYADLDAAFFTRMVASTLADDTLQVPAVVPAAAVDVSSSILSELSRQGVKKLVGHIPYDVLLESASQGPRRLAAVLKSKPTDRDVIHVLGNLSTLGNQALATAFKQHGGQIDFAGCHLRELAVYRQRDPRFRRYVPDIYGVYQDDARDIYLVLMERLEDMELMNSANDVSGWTPQHIYAALDGIADIHSIWLGREAELWQHGWLSNSPTAARMQAASPLWELLAVQAHDEFPEWFGDAELHLFRTILAQLPDWWQLLESSPRTLIHNDFNPRNLAFRKTPEGLRLCVYDWELATINVPQHDVAELLLFVLDDRVTLDVLRGYVEHHRRALEHSSGQSLEPQLWWQGFCAALNDLLMNRIAMYCMAHSAKHYAFMERVFATLRHILQLVRA